LSRNYFEPGISGFIGRRRRRRRKRRRRGV
jgi:hypothetical protein